MKSMTYLLFFPATECSKTRAYEVSVVFGTSRVLRIGVSLVKVMPSRERAPGW